jgi:hypothetical protein
VGKDLVLLVSGFLAVPTEKINAFSGKGFGYPLPLVLGKKGEGCGPDMPGIQGGILHAPGCAHMSPNELGHKGER